MMRAVLCIVLSWRGNLGTVFDVSHKKDIYGPGKSYGVFAGRDGSKGLGMSSLKPEDAVADYSDLSESDMKVLNDWHAFFSYVSRFFSCISIDMHVNPSANDITSPGALRITPSLISPIYSTCLCCRTVFLSC
jgi:hypothetical protein